MLKLNRKLLEDTANGSYEQGSDGHWNEWHAKMNEDGTQTWVQTRDGKVVNGGINQEPRTYNTETGLSRQERPN